jgi:hypothetical protein
VLDVLVLISFKITLVLEEIIYIIYNIVMFGLHKYLDKLFKIKWYFEKKDQPILEEILLVEFKENDDNFLVEKVHYTYVDILLGLEEFDFTITKKDEDIKLKINKI